MWIGIFGEKIAIVSDNAIDSQEKFGKINSFRPLPELGSD